MLYHASTVAGLTVLQPHISNHGVPMLYFSQKREKVFMIYFRLFPGVSLIAPTRTF